MGGLEIFALMMFAHALADYPLQGDFLAAGKNHKNPIPGVPWQHPLIAHSIIHGGFVGLVTGNIWLGLAETVCHTVIDWLKCGGHLNYHGDQALHVLCKVVWLVIWLSM